MDTTQKPHLSHISLCFGYGGIDLGLHRIFGDRLRLAAVCEIEAFALENALSKMEAGLLPPAPIWTDLRTFPWEEFQNVNLVSGGFPCQPFSAAGKRDGDQDPRHLFPFIIDGIKRCRPGLVFLENVEGILSSKLTGEGWADPAGTPVLLHVIRELERVGYKATAGIFSASEVGAPHQRKRVFIMAYRSDERLGCWETERWAISDWSKRAEIWNQPIGQGGAYRELANSKCEGSQGGIFGREDTQRETLNGHSGCSGSSCGVWPSRPGEQQYAWEPPRVTKGMAHTHSSRGEEPEHQHANIPSGSSRGNAEAMGNTSGERSHRGGKDSSGLQSEVLGEGYEPVGNSSNWRGGESRDEACEGEGCRTARSGWGNEEQRKTERSLGRDAYESPIGVDISELSGLSNSELADISEWMVKTDNRTDELRLLGNGVVPATATRAFLTLLEKLTK